jgi:hypothetical protein
MADLERTCVSGMERGERNPSLATLLRIADARREASGLATRAEQIDW